MSHFNLLYYTILYRTVPYFKKSNNRLAVECSITEQTRSFTVNKIVSDFVRLPANTNKH